MTIKNETNNKSGMIQNDAWATEDGVNGGTATPCADYPLAGISLPDTMTVKRGERVTLTASLTPSNPTDASVTWSSSNSYVASVTGGGVYNAQGTVQGNKPGTVTITASAHSGPNIVGDTCQVTVAPNEGDVRAIAISPSAATLDVGEQRLLTVTFTPANPTKRTLYWTSSDTDIVAVNSVNGMVLAKAVGTAIITAHAMDGSGVTGTCVVSVGRELVVISRDSDYGIDGFDLETNYNKVEFTDSGKVWHCIDEDMIFNQTNASDPILIDRSNYNFYKNYHVNKEDNTVISTYTSDELRLLYAIDPYGVADYVRRYAAEFPGLEETIGYKDDIFEALFGRRPKRYARYVDTGNWHESSDTDLSEIISESELLFGMHPVYDMAIGVQLIELAIDLFQFLWELFAGKLKAPIESIGKVFFGFLAFGEAVYKNELASYVTDSIVEKELEKLHLDWISKLTSANDVIQSFLDVLELFFINNAGFEKTLEYCYNKTPYIVYIQRGASESLSLIEIHNKLRELTD